MSITRNPDGTATVTTTLPEFITTVEAANLLGIRRPVLIQLIKDGALTGHERNEGRHTVLRTHEVLDFRTAQLKRQRAAAIELMELTDELEQQFGVGKD